MAVVDVNDKKPAGANGSRRRTAQVVDRRNLVVGTCGCPLNRCNADMEHTNDCGIPHDPKAENSHHGARSVSIFPRVRPTNMVLLFPLNEHYTVPVLLRTILVPRCRRGLSPRLHDEAAKAASHNILHKMMCMDGVARHWST